MEYGKFILHGRERQIRSTHHGISVFLTRQSIFTHGNVNRYIVFVKHAFVKYNALSLYWI
jgi:hypothetical protein